MKKYFYNTREPKIVLFNFSFRNDNYTYNVFINYSLIIKIIKIVTKWIKY